MLLLLGSFRIQDTSISKSNVIVYFETNIVLANFTCNVFNSSDEKIQSELRIESDSFNTATTGEIYNVTCFGVLPAEIYKLILPNQCDNLNVSTIFTRKCFWLLAQK